MPSEYIRNPNMEMTVSTDPESPGCAEYIQVQGAKQCSNSY